MAQNSDLLYIRGVCIDIIISTLCKTRSGRVEIEKHDWHFS